MNPSYGIIVGRFQVPELHSGHMELFRAVRGFHSRVIVFLGVPASLPTRRDPLDFESRRLMIQSKFPDITVLPLSDKRTDEEWSAELDSDIGMVCKYGDVTLYGARDSFLPHYKGRYKPIELTLPIPPYSGTTIREGITNEVRDSTDFRAGIIHAVNNRPPVVYTTVDVAILHEREILLAQKPGCILWRFIGGFVDSHKAPMTDRWLRICPGSIEQDAYREVFEETGLDVSDVKYIGSRTIDDWRYKSSPDCIKTLFFTAQSMTKGGTAKDDISRTSWFSLETIFQSEYLIVPEHRELLSLLRRTLK